MVGVFLPTIFWLDQHNIIEYPFRLLYDDLSNVTPNPEAIRFRHYTPSPETNERRNSRLSTDNQAFGPRWSTNQPFLNHTILVYGILAPFSPLQYTIARLSSTSSRHQHSATESNHYSCSPLSSGLFPCSVFDWSPNLLLMRYRPLSFF